MSDEEGLPLGVINPGLLPTGAALPLAEAVAALVKEHGGEFDKAARAAAENARDYNTAP